MSTDYIYRIPLDLVDNARSRINSANKRLEKAGISEQFTWTEENITVKKDGKLYGAVDIMLSSPSLSFGGWEFVASVDILSAGTVLSTPSFVNADNLPRPSSHRCDHCGKVRSRKYSYLLRNEEGEVKQVGKSCLELFLGVSPVGLWALQWDDLEEFTLDHDDSHWGHAPQVYPVKEIVRISMFLTENGRNYISRERASYSGDIATADSVSQILNADNAFTSKEREERYAVYLKAMDIPENEVEEVISCASNIEGSYGENLSVVMAEEYIPAKHIGLAASVTSAYHRQVEKFKKEISEKEFKESLKQEFIADPGSKISGINVTITKVIGGFTDLYGGVKSLLLAVDDEGHLIKWMGSVPDEVDGVKVEAGNRFEVLRATVKSNDVYQGDYQTVVNRVKFKPVA